MITAHEAQAERCWGEDSNVLSSTAELNVHEGTRVPGAAAPTCNVLQLWNSMARLLLASSSNFAVFLKSLLGATPPAEGGTAQSLWPMSLPYPEVWRPELSKKWCSLARRARKKSVNLVVALLNWLHMNRPTRAPAALALGSRLSKKQWRVVEHFERLMADVAESGDIDAAAMGRSAAKVEGLDEILIDLQRQAVSWTEAGYEHRWRAQSGVCTARPRAAGHCLADPGVVVGKLKTGAPVLAKSVDATRLSVPNQPPEFDPSVLFGFPHKEVYVDPVARAMEPASAVEAPPKVRVHASRDQALQFVKFLDDRGLLTLAPAEKVRRSHLCGAFGLVKDLHKDRLILDARPANMLEDTLHTWTRTMGTVQALLQHEIQPNFNMYFSGTDLRDYYYCFRVTSRRAWRNAMRLPLTPSQVASFQCFSEDMWQEPVLFPCLKTLAMGDNNAVELGQYAHLKIGLDAGIIFPRELLTTHGRAPRGPFSCGLIIDDIIFAEQLKAPPSSSAPSGASRRLSAMCAEYERHQLRAHPGKTFRDQTRAEFWGAAVDGKQGLVRPSPKRLVPLLSLTSRVAALGFATVALLEILAGCWVNVLQYRRRALCLLDSIYTAQLDRCPDDVVRLAPCLVDELWSLAIVGPIIASDLRAQSMPKVFLSDASETAQAVVAAEVPQPFARELQRHCLSRGGWSKLLSPWKVWLKSHGKLEEAEEMPSGVPLVSHPLWLQLARSLQFESELFERVRKRKHINLLELEIILKFERQLALEHQDVRYNLASDSQVTLACLVKGRSSSPHLNRLLQRSLPSLLGSGIYGGYGFIPSLANVADDPTREHEIRAPVASPPEWLLAAFHGQFEALDVWLEERGYDPLAVAELPFAEGRAVSRKVLAEDFIPQLKAVQKPERLARFDQFFPSAESGAAESAARTYTARVCTEVSQTAADSTVSSTCTVSEFHRECLPLDQSAVSPQFEKTRVEQNGAKEPSSLTKKKKKRPQKSVDKKAQSKTPRCCFQQGAPSADVAKTGSYEPPGSHRSVQAAMARSLGALPELSEHAKDLLRHFPRAQFFAPGGRRAGADFKPTCQGVLDLYSGASGVARYISRKYGVWVLTIDYEHGPGQNLLDTDLQARLMSCLEAGCFAAVGAAPDCSSFSRAVTPAVRDAANPFGRPGISANMQEKVARGNQHALFIFSVVQFCDRKGIPYWVENPDGSFLWLLPYWVESSLGSCSSSYRFDQCRFHAPWRKRTRVATNTDLTGIRELCQGGHQHQILTGRSSAHACSWTRVAQTYPRSLCRRLGDALMRGVRRQVQKLDIAGCARTLHARIGEASHPGPRHAAPLQPRDPAALADVRLIEPSTAARQDRMLEELGAWLRARLSEETINQLYLCPALAVSVLKTYAMHLFASGRKLYELRYTLIAVQHRYPHLRSSMAPVWAVVSKWELYQPLQHRKPLPELLFKAMFVLACLKGWTRWSASLLLGFEGIARIGEILAARRHDLLLPSDLAETESAVAFLKIRLPKTRFRGRGRVQHLKIRHAASLPFLERVFGALDPCLPLFPLSAHVFRKRWDLLLDLLQIPGAQRPTPASIRGGGAILAYRRGEPIADILWRMRLASQPTLASYLQELAAESLLAFLAPTVRQRLIHVASLFPVCLQSLG